MASDDKLFGTQFPFHLVKEQSILRCKIVSIVVLLVTFSTFFLAWGNEFNSIVVAASLFYMASSYFLLYLVLNFCNRANIVSIIGIVLDIVIMTVLMSFGGANEAAIYGGYLFLIIGNGLRFGKAYMRFVNLLSVLSFSIVITFSEFWNEHLILGMGLFIWLIVIPTYLSVLLTRIEDAVQKTETANEAKTMFIANMSHEIRTPLTAIVGFGKTLLQQNLSTERKTIAITSIIRNGSFLSSIVDDILDISKIEAGKLEVEFRNCSIFEIVQEVEFLFRQKIEDEGKQLIINFEFPIPINIYSDSMRIKQILINLCSNAVKFTSLGEIEINISYNKETQMTQFSIKDSGIGLTEDQVEMIFSRFTQADISTTRKYGGTGLGLTICKKLALMLNGNIWVTSTLGKGSEFSFCVKSGDIANELFTNKVPKDKSTDCKKKASAFKVTGNILLVEDVVDNQILISMILKDMGATVDIAENGLLAIEFALRKNYDLILMDLQMPVMGGEEAIIKLRSKNYMGPIYVLSANVMKRDRSKSNEISCQGFLAKPISEEKLFHVVASCLTTDDVAYVNLEPDSDIVIDDDKMINSTLLEKNAKKYINLVSRFVRELKSRIDEIDDAYRSKEIEKLGEYLHKLKGVGGNMGYNGITDLTLQMEELVLQGLYNEIPSAIAELYDIEEKIQQGIRNYTIN